MYVDGDLRSQIAAFCIVMDWQPIFMLVWVGCYELYILVFVIQNDVDIWALKWLIGLINLRHSSYLNLTNTDMKIIAISFFVELNVTSQRLCIRIWCLRIIKKVRITLKKSHCCIGTSRDLGSNLHTWLSKACIKPHGHHDIAYHYKLHVSNIEKKKTRRQKTKAF